MKFILSVVIATSSLFAAVSAHAIVKRAPPAGPHWDVRIFQALSFSLLFSGSSLVSESVSFMALIHLTSLCSFPITSSNKCPLSHYPLTFPSLLLPVKQQKKTTKTVQR